MSDVPGESQPISNEDAIAEELYRGIIGLHNDVEFTSWISKTLPESSWYDPLLVDVLSSEGVSIDPRHLPEKLQGNQLTRDDIRVIRESDSPLISLWGIANAHNIEARVWDYGSMQSRTLELEDMSDKTVQRELDLLRSLPLVHATSLDGFAQIMSEGEIVSNRVAVDRIIKLGKLLIQGNPGQTHESDRKRGLDKYVYFDFGRPSAIHPLGNDEKQASKDYLSRILVPHRFHEAVRERILRSYTIKHNPNGTSNYGYCTIEDFTDGQDMDPSSGYLAFQFSTYEVKVPHASASAIKRVIVRDPDILNNLVAKYGDKVEIVLSKEFGPGHYEKLKIV